MVALLVLVAACTNTIETPTPIGGEDRPGQTVGTPEGTESNQDAEAGNVGAESEPGSIPATLGPAGEGDLGRADAGTFSIEITGEVETTLDSENGADYLTFYEEPAGDATITDEPGTTRGQHTLNFVSADESYAVLITFPDQLQAGSYGVGMDAADPSGQQPISTRVELADRDTSFNVLNGGTFNVDSLNDGMVSGSFEFQLSSTDDAAQVLTLAGTFDNLILDKDVMPEETQRNQ